MFPGFEDALAQVLSPPTLLLCLIGVVGGMAVGATPGLSATVGLALLLPVTFTLDPTSGLVLMGAFYSGAIFGGSFTAILVNAPGTPSSIATTFDGYPMTKQGRSETAITAVTTASVFGGLIGVAGLLLLGPLVADVVLAFGPQEYFWLGIFGLTMIASLATESLIKGFAAGFVGLLISAIGIAPVGGDVRFTFGFTEMQGGVPLIVALIGFFTVPAMIDLMADPADRSAAMHKERAQREPGMLARTVRRVLSRPINLFRSAVIGAFVGMLPGAGGNVANLIAYNEAKRASKTPERFGKGELDGVVAPETANNAVVGGGLIPLLTLGIPGAPADAVIFGVLMLHGLRPGADLFTEQGPLTFTFILALAIAALLLAPVGLVAGRGLQRTVVRTPTHLLVPAIALLAIIGAYAVRNNPVDVVLMLGLGVLGYGLRHLGLPPPAIVLGVVLGPIIESGLGQGLLAASGDDRPWLSFFTRPISAGIIVVVLLALLWPLLSRWRARRRQAGSAAPNTTASTGEGGES
ncbi:putative tricarboxylic transport membrane protein [Spinactinospora alkalitolerans]|uniref:Putative tricarboxylic transport membrane protein n=1 Tax=Spinactinospora alkalitolerans TaxID=687207 RepID=A0A852TY39_9ACTN|nr:tripartite tricarboxylate transporter permease [Spinactinospora alkalitolerans]NYE47892.1 putative tricarboxylic transport membrane protein [Spinactinospora alkalitolerans]